MSDALTQARELLEQQRFQDALELLHSVETMDSVVKVSVARALSGLGKWEQAHSLFSEVIEQDPSSHEALAGRGLLYFLTGNFRDALVDYSQAIENGPSVGRYRGLRGVLFAQAGDAPRAISDLEAAYDLGCHDPAFTLSRAQIQLTVRDATKAQEAIALAERGGGDEVAIAILEGALSMLKGDPKEAYASYRFAVEKAPESITNWMNFLALTAQLDRANLIPEAERALELHPDSEELIQLAVGAYREGGKKKRAIRLLKEAVKRNSKSPLLYFQLGLGYAYAEKFEKAIEHLTSALELAPRFPRALDARGNCLEKLGRTDEAQADFEKSLAIRQEDAEKQEVRRQMVPPSGNGAEPPRKETD